MKTVDQQPVPWPVENDRVITNPEVAWDTHTSVPRDAERVWELVSRLSLMSEGGAGWLLPKSLEKIAPESLHSVQSVEDPLPPQRQLGDVMRDFPKETQATVVHFDPESKTWVLESDWPISAKRPDGFHYSWGIRVLPNGEESFVDTRIRIEHSRRPHLIGSLMSRADQWAMRELFAKGLTDRIPAMSGGLLETSPLFKKRTLAVGGAALLGAAYMVGRGFGGSR